MTVQELHTLSFTSNWQVLISLTNSRRQDHGRGIADLSEEMSESEEERKKSFSKFSHDLKKDPRHKQTVPHFDTSTSVSFISRVDRLSN
jgi:hypothetical protein